MSELETKKQNHDLLDSAVSEMSKLLKRWAAKGKGLPGEDKNGIVVMYNKKIVGLLMFMFVTKDNLSIELEFDLSRLRAEGKEYMELIVEIIITQLEAARKEKQKNESVVLLPAHNNIEPAITVQDSVRKALRDNPTRSYY